MLGSFGGIFRNGRVFDDRRRSDFEIGGREHWAFFRQQGKDASGERQAGSGQVVNEALPPQRTTADGPCRRDRIVGQREAIALVNGLHFGGLERGEQQHENERKEKKAWHF